MYGGQPLTITHEYGGKRLGIPVESKKHFVQLVKLVLLVALVETEISFQLMS